MARITRTIKVRGSKWMTGIVFFLIAIMFLILGWLKQSAVLIWSAISILLLILFFTIARRQTVVTLDNKGIHYKSLFWDLHLPWQDVQSCGVYYIQQSEVHQQSPQAARTIITNQPVYYIFASVRPDYFPKRRDRFIGRSSIHFRWHPDAWDVVIRHVNPEAYH